MTKLYRITPLEKKSVEYFVDVYETMPDGSIRGFDVTETWRWGQGWREEDNPVMEGQDTIFCNPQEGWGCELDDLCAVYVNFSDGFTEEEKAEIEAILRGEQEDEDGRWGTAWIYDGNHNWQVEDDHVSIIGPFKVDLCDENGDVIEENTKLEPRPDPRTSWPWSVDNPKPEEE